MTLNDLRDDLEPDIHMDEDFRPNKIKAVNNHKIKSFLNDILSKGKDINISGRKYIRLYASKTNFFDGLSKNLKLKDIDLDKKIPKLSIKKKKTIQTSLLKIISLIFIGILLFGFSLKISVEYVVNSGYNKIIEIKENSGSFEFVQGNINNAKFDFIIADTLFKPFLIIPNYNIKNVYHIIKGGKEITKLGDNLIHLYSDLREFIGKKGLENIELTNLIYNQREEIFKAENLLFQALYHYDQIQNLGDTALEYKVNGAILKLKKGLTYLHTIDTNFMTFLNILGHNEKRKYLVVLQNNDEIRPTGGFMGSLGVITIYRGKIIEFEKSDVYAYEWEINKNYTDKISAPKGLDQITGTFGLRDANYFINFDDSSKQIKYFLNKIQKNIDGIVYINQNIILDFLEKTGNIYFDKIDEQVNKDNFALLMSTLVEAKTFKVGSLGTPKKILFDFSEKFIEVLHAKKDYFAYLNILLKNINSRDIVFYSFIPEENSLLWKLGINGTVNYSDTLDFTYPVYTSLSGNKSDRYMKRDYKKITNISENCSIENTLEINSAHHFTKNNEQELDNLLLKYDIENKDHIQYIQGRGDNYQYVRVLLPKDALVEIKEGMEIKKYENYQVLEFFLRTRRFETSQYVIHYSLVNSECKKYSYKLYKQPGIPSYDIESQLNGEVSKIYELKGDFYIE